FISTPTIGINNIRFTTRDTDSGYYGWLDAIDYSWAPGYYTNRNMNYIGAFINASMTLLSGNQQDGVWNYTFDKYPNNQYIIYRIYIRDAVGNTNVTDWQRFRVFDSTAPNMLNIIQEPTNLSLIEAVNITVLISENFEINSVWVENNQTGTWMNDSMDLLTGTFQLGWWNYTFTNYPINKTIMYRIIATDISGYTAISELYSFSAFFISHWEIPTDLDVDINLAKNSRTDISFAFKNEGTTTMCALNFTIVLPPNWVTDVETQSFSQLLPGDEVLITFEITAPETFNSTSIELVFITFEANIYETGQKVEDVFTIVVTGVEAGRWFIWLIIIVGSAAAAAATSFVFIHRRRGPSEGPKDKKKGKSSNKLKKALIADSTDCRFPRLIFHSAN
ncbi:MAG: NEW3 domain-containing protein, partial [Candidatus Helarchaeota archaeon]